MTCGKAIGYIDTQYSGKCIEFQEIFLVVLSLTYFVTYVGNLKGKKEDVVVL